MGTYIIIGVIITFISLLILFKDELIWFISAIKVTFLNQKGIKDIQKEGMDKRNLTNESIKNYIKETVKHLNSLGIDYSRTFELSQELERHLRYSRFSEKYVLELFYEILEYMNLNKENVTLKINYISRSMTMPMMLKLQNYYK